MTIDDDALSIIHHGRNRAKLLELVYRGHECDHGDGLLPHEKFTLADKAAAAIARLTPDDDTKLDRQSVAKYIDLEKVDSPDFIYGYEDVIDAVLSHTSNNLEPELRDWLIDRGVTEEQVRSFRSFSQVRSRRHRIYLGIEVHPALQKWVGCSRPKGIMMSAFGCDGALSGVHLRMLSTVPKIKFGASVPLLHVSSNVWCCPRLYTHAPDFEPGMDVWLVEGIFDGLALDRVGKHYFSPSSGTWSCEQLFILVSQLRRCKPGRVICAHDNDRVGLKENLFLWSVLRPEFQTEIFAYPKGVKDMSELVCKHRSDPTSGSLVNAEKVAEQYLAMPYKPVVQFDHYLDFRNSAYNNDRYAWAYLKHG